MSLKDGRVWWEENQGTTRRGLAIAALVALVVGGFVLRSEISHFLATHPLWQSTLLAIPPILMCILAYFELAHSDEANELRREANCLHRRIAELEEEKTGHLQQIAQNTQRPASQAERKASILRRHLGEAVSVSEGNGGWGTSPQIAQVNEDYVVALFSPRSHSSGAAWCAYVHCDDLEVVEPPQGPLRLRVLKRYGDTVQLGEITKWEDRAQVNAVPGFDKGNTVHYATFSKPGTSETRRLYIYASRDGTNSFLLEASTGEKVILDNIGVSKRFSVMEIDYAAEGFNRTASGTSGGNTHPIFIR